MNTFVLTLNPPRAKAEKISLNGPSCWKELTDPQSVAMMRFRQQVEANPATQFAVLKLLYSLKPRHQQWLFDINFLRRQGIDPADQLLFLEYGQQILDTIAWLGQDDPDATFIQRFNAFGKTFQGPQAALGDCNFDEFMAADKAFRDNNLPLLAAILYRTRDGSGKRVAFDHKEAKQVAIRFAKLDKAILERIAFSFGCTLLRLSKLFKHVFKSGQDDQTLTGKKAPGTWLDVVIGMTKFDATKIAQIESINLYLVLKTLDSQVQQAVETEARLNALKQNGHV